MGGLIVGEEFAVPDQSTNTLKMRFWFSYGMRATIVSSTKSESAVRDSCLFKHVVDLTKQSER